MQKIYGLLYAMILLFGLRCYADIRFTFNNMTNEAITIIFIGYMQGNLYQTLERLLDIPPWKELYKRVPSKIDASKYYCHECHLSYEILIKKSGELSWGNTGGFITKNNKNLTDKGSRYNHHTGWDITKNKEGKFIVQQKPADFLQKDLMKSITVHRKS